MEAPYETPIRIENEQGESIEVVLVRDGDRPIGTIMIQGVRYHIERLPREEMMALYVVDTDPDYHPKTDAEGYCYIVAPFSGRGSDPSGQSHSYSRNGIQE
jgi:hypothetical protein